MSVYTLQELPEPPQGRVGWPWTATNPQLPDTMPDGVHWPRISIVTPSYNQVQYMEETLRSVLLQGYPNLEYIVMDGGSDDGSVEIIHKYEPFLSYLHIGPDGGQAAAIKEGFRHATGDILAWLNSDDRYLPGALARAGHFFSKHDHVIFGNGDVNLVDGEGRFIRRWYAAHPNRFLTSNLSRHGWPQQGCFWRRQAYEQVGGVDASLRFCMDRDLFIRLTGTGPSRRIPGPPFADFRKHDQSKSSTIRHILKAENAALIEKYGKPNRYLRKKILNTFWEFWLIPVKTRACLNQIFGWEY